MTALPPIRLTKAKGVVPVEQPVVEVTEEERRQIEAQEFIRDHPPRQSQATPEEIEAERQATLASIPHAAGRPIPEATGITEEQLRNNPSNYQPKIEDSIAALVPVIHENPSVLTEAAKPAVVAKVAPTDERQQWVCVQGDGLRTVTDAVKHPVFGSNAHFIDELVRCPVCTSSSVRKLGPGENPDAHP